MQTYKLLWHSAVKMSKNVDNFLLFLELGIFPWNWGNKYFFAIGTWPNIGRQNKQENTVTAYWCIEQIRYEKKG